MNAGAHGWSLADVVEEVEVVRRRRAAAGCRPELDWGYRFCAPAEGSVVTAVRLAAERGRPRVHPGAPRDPAAARRISQPRGVRTFGSTFKNPPGGPPGSLLEAAGLKGVRRGGAEVSTVHANFLVNLGDATTADVLALMSLMREAVERTSGMSLEPEVRLLGAVSRGSPGRTSSAEPARRRWIRESASVGAGQPGARAPASGDHRGLSRSSWSRPACSSGCGPPTSSPCRRVTAAAMDHVTEEQIAGATSDARGVSLLASRRGAIEEDLAALPYVRVGRRVSRRSRTRSGGPAGGVRAGRPACRLLTGASGWWRRRPGAAKRVRPRSGLAPGRVGRPDCELEPGEDLPADRSRALPVGALLEEIEAPATACRRASSEIAVDGRGGDASGGRARAAAGRADRTEAEVDGGERIIQQYLRDGKQIEYVDVSVPDRVAVKAK